MKKKEKNEIDTISEITETTETDTPKEENIYYFSCKKYPQLSIVLQSMGQIDEDSGRKLSGKYAVFSHGIYKTKDTKIYKMIKDCEYFKQGVIKEEKIEAINPNIMVHRGIVGTTSNTENVVSSPIKIA